MIKKMMLLAALCGLLMNGLATVSLAQSDVNPNTVTSQKLQSIRIPQLKFENAPLGEVLNYISKQSLEEDPGPVVTGVEFIYMPPKENAPNLTISLRNIKVGTALDIICAKTGMQWDYNQGLIVVKPGKNDSNLTSPSQPMKTEVFDFSRQMVNRAKYSNSTD
ncbi:hypothetical protein [Cerasicoccus fimbriatus]|uniref:hypothetical protein n=1 Tax=Cerasicoccus fimbriatus TaxID=3014554 RepID=UPI0022B52EF2|nr:hypothetical protein [Cerasicoccus sp. TK19100]